MESLAAQASELGRMVVAKAIASPVTLIFGALVTICVATRLTSGRSPRALDGGLKTAGVLPYWVPYLGHALWLVFFPEKLVKARSATQDGVFGISMGGYTHNIIVKPSLAKSVFMLKPSIVDNHSMIYYLMEKFFGGPKAFKTSVDEGFVFKDIHHLVNALMKESYLENAMEVVARGVEAQVADLARPRKALADQSPWERAARVQAVIGDPAAVEVSFFPLIRTFVASIASPTVMGKAFMENNPGIIHDLWDFDEGMPLFIMQLPRWTPIPMLRKAYAARSRIRAAFEEFHAALAKTIDGQDPGPRWKDMSDVAELMYERNKTWRAGGVPMEVWSGSEMSLYWAMNINSNNIVFWLLTRLYSSPTHLALIRAELAPFTRPTSPSPCTLDVEGITRRSPLLKAAYYECLRLDTASTTIKTVFAPFTIKESPADAFDGRPPQAFRIDEGDFIHVDHALHQMDPRYYPDPDVFRPERFLVKGEGVEGGLGGQSSKLEAHQGTIRPFGGGHNLCKGYKFAEREILLFVAGVLSVWDIEPVGEGAEGGVMTEAGWRIPAHVRGTGAFVPKGEFRVWIVRRG